MRSLFIALIFLAGVEPLLAAPAEDFPLGRWYTEGAENGNDEQVLIENDADHTFTKKAAYVTRCDAVVQESESGTWTFDGSRYGEVTLQVGGEPHDPEDPDNIDSFEVGRVDADHVTLFDPKTGVTWAARRVTDFVLPPSAHCAT